MTTDANYGDRSAGRGPSRRKRGSIVLRAAVLVALAGGVAVIGYAALGGKGGAASSASVTSDRAVVKKTNFEIMTKCSGELEARNQIEIRSRLESQSTIAELAPEGTSVKAGDLLVRLNSDKIEQDILEQTLQVESAKAELVAAENGYNIQVNENESLLRQAESKVTLAKLALDQWESGEVAKKFLELNLALERADRDLKRLTEKYDRSKMLHSQGFLSKNELDLDEIAWIEATAAIAKAKKEDEIYRQYKLPQERETFTSALTEAKAELERVKMNNEIELASKEAARTNRRKQLAVREEKLKNLEEQLAAATMRAPQDGLVVYATSMSSGRGFGGDREGPLQIGRQVFPNELLMILPDTSDMIASVRVQESLAGRIRPGQRATVQVDAAGGKMFQGVVESTSVLAETGGWRDPNLREYTVKVALDQQELAGAGLKPSMRVDSSITLGEVADAPAVPVPAVFNERPVRFVYVEQTGKFAKVPVKMGRRSDTFAEITAGVSEGQVVLLREPTSGEVLVRPWDKASLELAGYALDADGKPVVAGAAERGPGGPPDGNRQRAGRNRGGREGGGTSDATGAGNPRTTAEGSAPAAKDGERKDADSAKSSEIADKSPADKPAAPAGETGAQGQPSSTEADKAAEKTAE
ncbi:MAG: hypothetical protein GIKADHBN_02065 [Phycisphaerales bacterium]|nr:hypothetical protein [Phycisphaerales bacterium]